MDTPPLDEDAPLPPQLLFLKRLVTVLAVVMIAGFLLLIVSLVIRLNANPMTLPNEISLPEGATATAFTQGETWFAIVTDQNQILIYDRETREIFQTVQIDR